MKKDLDQNIYAMEAFIHEVEEFIARANVDRRRSERHELGIQMRHRVRNAEGYSKVQEYHSGHLINISKHGMLLGSPTRTPSDGELEIIIPRGEQEAELRALCRIIYTKRLNDGAYNTGVEIQKVLK